MLLPGGRLYCIMGCGGLFSFCGKKRARSATEIENSRFLFGIDGSCARSAGFSVQYLISRVFL